MMFKEYAFLSAGVFLSYALFFALVPVVSGIVNAYFYGGEGLYRLTWSHYVLPAAGAISMFLVVQWLLKEADWPRKVGHYVALLFAALVITYLGFVLGVQAYRYTFVLYGAGQMGLLQLWYFFLFTPFWAVVPGIFSGWLAAFLLHCKAIKRGSPQS